MKNDYFIINNANLFRKDQIASINSEFDSDDYLIYKVVTLQGKEFTIDTKDAIERFEKEILDNFKVDDIIE